MCAKSCTSSRVQTSTTTASEIYEQIAQTVSRAAAGDLSGRFFEGTIYVEAGASEGGRQSEDDAAEDCDAEGVGEGRDVEGSAPVVDDITANTSGDGVLDPVHAPNSEKRAGRAAESKQQQRFCEQLPGEPPAPGAQCSAHGEFFGAVAGARETRIGDIGAGDQQHESDEAETDHDLLRTFVLTDFKEHGADQGRLIGIGFRVELFQARGNCGQVRAGLLRRDAGLQPAEG